MVFLTFQSQGTFTSLASPWWGLPQVAGTQKSPPCAGPTLAVGALSCLAMESQNINRRNRAAVPDLPRARLGQGNSVTLFKPVVFKYLFNIYLDGRPGSLSKQADGSAGGIAPGQVAAASP